MELAWLSFCPSLGCGTTVLSHEQPSNYQAAKHGTYISPPLILSCWPNYYLSVNQLLGHKNGEENKQTNSSAFHVIHDNVKNKQLWQWNVIHLRAFFFIV